MEDPDIGPILQWLVKGERPDGTEDDSSSPCIWHKLNTWSNMYLSQGLLFRKFYRSDNIGSPVLGTSLSKLVLHQMHDSVLSGHLGYKKTFEKMFQRFYWFVSERM